MNFIQRVFCSVAVISVTVAYSVVTLGLEREIADLMLATFLFSIAVLALSIIWGFKGR